MVNKKVANPSLKIRNMLFLLNFDNLNLYFFYILYIHI